jgi:hypothetical protein
MPLDKKKKRDSEYVMVQNPYKDEENLSSSEESLSEKQQEYVFNRTTKF